MSSPTRQQPDEVYEEWTAAVRPELDEEMQLVLDQQQRRYRSSLGALFCVSKEWSKLAAPLRFRTLKASKSDKSFLMYVAFQRAAHFTRLELDTDDYGDLGAALSSIARAQRLERVDLHGVAVCACAWDVSPGASTKSYALNYHAENAFRRFATSVPELRLFDVPAPFATLHLSRWRVALRRLHLTFCCQADTPPLSTAKLAHALCKLSNLVELCITTTEDEDVEGQNRPDCSTLTAGLSKPEHPPPVQHLSISSSLVVESAPSLSATFSNTLETLSLVASSDHADQSATFDTQVFPLVTSLRVAGWRIYDTACSVTKARFPALQHLEIESRDAVDDLPSDDLIPAFQDQLASLRVHDGRALDLVAAASLVKFVEEQTTAALPLSTSPHLPLTPSPLLFETRLHALHNRLWNASAVSASRPFVCTLTDLLNEEVERAKRNDDEASFVGLAATTRGLELERLARRG
ncbi:hypothetical protein JCM8547_000506 [Rhodosporidiobolus lusitaniae]